MRSLLALLLGAALGVIGTVLLFTLDPDFDAGGSNGAGGGNARISLDEDALAELVRRELPELGLGTETVVNVRVRENGLIDVETAVGAGGIGVRSNVVLNPNIVEGRLKLDVVSAGVGDMVVPEELAQVIEEPLQARLDSLAEGFDYRLTSITTTDRRLTLEIAI